MYLLNGKQRFRKERNGFIVISYYKENVGNGAEGSYIGLVVPIIRSFFVDVRNSF